MKRIWIVFLFALKTIELFAQNPNIKRTWHWYYGEYAAIDFSSGVAAIDTNSAMLAFEGVSSISDTSGNLLFYSNGVKVWNRLHQVMPNGTGLMGGIGNSAQAVLILPMPQSPNLFYVFTADEANNYGAKGVRYSIVDMTLDGGNGDITNSKNILLFAPCIEKLAAVNHCNDTSVWIVGHKAQSDEYYSYLLTPQGLDTNPVITHIGAVLDTSISVFPLQCVLKFSSDGKKAAAPSAPFGSRDRIELYDFNSETGLLSNLITIKASSPDSFLYTTEFSINNKLLYASCGYGKLIQYDISSNDSTTILNSRYVVFDSLGGLLGQLQKAPDGKIYCGRAANLYYLSVINYPDSTGAACNFVKNSFYSGGGNHKVFAGLPNYNCSYFGSGMSGGCISGINEIHNQTIKIYPNPARDWIVVEGVGIKAIEIINLFGNTCYYYTAAASSLQHIVRLNSLSRGIYFIKISTNKDTSIIKKIILN